MDNQKKWMIGIIVVLLLINIATLTSFWMMKKPHHHPPRMEKFFEKELDLTPEQTAVFNELKQAHKLTRKRLQDSIMLYKNELFKEMLSDNPNQTNLDSFNLKIGNIQIALDKSFIQHYEELKTHCTSVEQKEKLKEIFKKIVTRQPHSEKKR